MENIGFHVTVEGGGFGASLSSSDLPSLDQITFDKAPSNGGHSEEQKNEVELNGSVEFDQPIKLDAEGINKIASGLESQQEEKQEERQEEKQEEQPEFSVSLPEEPEGLVRENIDERLQRGEFRAVKLETKDDFKYPAYVIDISKCGPLMPSLVASFEWLTSEKQNEGAYEVSNLYLKSPEGIFSIGAADSGLLRTVLDTYVRSAFGENAVLLYSRKDGKFKKYNRRSTDGMRFDL